MEVMQSASTGEKGERTYELGKWESIVEGGDIEYALSVSALMEYLKNLLWD